MEMEARQAQIINLVDSRMLGKKFCYLLWVLADQVHFGAQGSQVIKSKQRIRRRSGWAIIPVREEFYVFGEIFFKERIVIFDIGHDWLAADQGSSYG